VSSSVVSSAEPSPAKGSAASIAVPGGTYTVGVAGENHPSVGLPRHVVVLEPFRLDVTEVTVGAYRECVLAGVCSGEGLEGHRACNWQKAGRESHPINCIAYSQAHAYCSWKGQRLPTEEEWEVAAMLDYPGDYAMDVVKACHAGSECFAPVNACAPDAGTCPVGTHPLNASRLGLQDLLGNVAEWTEGHFCTGKPPWCRAHVLRGNTWASSQYESRTVRMLGPDAPPVPDLRRALPVIGFRCASRAR
jgi:formylglycine-generating enzyme required for sulfatase activity